MPESSQVKFLSNNSTQFKVWNLHDKITKGKVFLNENEILHVGSCGNIPTILRKDLYKKLVKLKVNSNFQKIASNGSAYSFIKPEIVCEIKLLEFRYILKKSIAVTVWSHNIWYGLIFMYRRNSQDST